MSCKPESTHHFACDCREERFRKLESENASLREEIEKLKADLAETTEHMWRDYKRAERYREALEKISKACSTNHVGSCDHSIAKSALEEEKK